MSTHITNKGLYFSIMVFGILMVGGFVYAYGESQPAVMGHSSGEIDWSQTIASALHTTGLITSDLGFCIGATCMNSIPKAVPTCASGQFLKADASGNWICSNPPSTASCEIVASKAGNNLLSAINIPSRCSQTGGCTLKIFQDYDGGITETNFVYYSGNKWINSAGTKATNGDSSAVSILSSTRLYVYDDNTGTENSVSQWAFWCQSGVPNCYIVAC